METQYRPLSDARRDLKIQWYRCPVDKAKLRELMQPNDLKGFFQAGGHLAVVACTGGLTIYFYAESLWVLFFAALFMHGTASTFLKGVAAHELGHGTVFKTPWLNQFFLRVYSLLGWHNQHEYAVSHTYHHRYTCHPDGDREIMLPQFPRLDAPYLLQLFTVNIFGGLMTSGVIPTIKGTVKTALGGYGASVIGEEWCKALYKTHPRERQKAVNWARLILLFHGGVLAAGVITEFWVLPLVLTFNPFFANWLKHFVGIPMHCGLRSDVPDFRKCVRTITLDPVSEFLYWRMNWHLEHHMYAGVPCYNLKKLHKLVAEDMPKPRTLLGAWREMHETWTRQRTDPNYAFDTPVPTPTPKIKDRDKDLESSIGEIAPDALATT